MRSLVALLYLAITFVVLGAAPAQAVDTDGDGLDDAVEASLGTNPGLADSDGDRIDDFVETNGGFPIDTDGDALIDALDDDSDGDGYTDLVEAAFDSDGDGTSDYRDIDSDDDGILDQDEFDIDFDSDGSPNRIDPDDDGDGIPTSIESTFDVDGDGNFNYLDLDSDGDGFSDAEEGVEDPDGDGNPNYVDFDSDEDTILDRDEFAIDFDGDGLPNRIDPDDDGDGIPTSIESTFDVDGDGNFNYLDLDSDGDGFSDAEEGIGDPDGDGNPNYVDFDSDEDTILDRDEFAIDFDGDGLPNRIDPDDDGDGIPTSIESTFDVDGDGNFNYLDLDSDGDGFSDAEEGVEDPDGDGNPNYVDFDSDDDGFSDAEERVAGSDAYDPTSTPETTVAPSIVRLSDVGNDQGRRLRLHWTRSSRDAVGSTEPIRDYAIYRRIDANRSTSADTPLLRAPAGDWDFVGSVPATTDDGYFSLVESLCDSTDAGVCWSVYFVRALTAAPGVFYDSAPDSGYSIDNLAPSAPAGFAVAYGTQNVLSWEPSPEDDFRYFKVYRGSDPGFTPETGTLVQTTTDTGWIDTAAGSSANYLVSAVDFAGNESPASSPATATGTGDAPTVRAALEQNVPNPFNPKTSIAFRLEAEGLVSLRIYDASGRRVRALVDAEVRTPGRHVVTWDGRDTTGFPVAAGVYLYSIEGPGITQTRRMVLVK